MPTSTQPRRHRVGQSGNTSVRPGSTAVRCDVQHAQDLRTIARSHMSVIGAKRPHPLLASSALIAAFSAALLAVLVYLNALDNPFVYDDFRLIVENSSIQNGTTLETVIVRDI